MTRLVVAVTLAFGLGLLAAGCGPSTSSSNGEPKPLVGDRIPKGAGKAPAK